MIVTTTGGIEGQDVESYLGVVTGRAVIRVSRRATPRSVNEVSALAAAALAAVIPGQI